MILHRLHPYPNHSWMPTSIFFWLHVPCYLKLPTTVIWWLYTVCDSVGITKYRCCGFSPILVGYTFLSGCCGLQYPAFWMDVGTTVPYCNMCCCFFPTDRLILSSVWDLLWLRNPDLFLLGSTIFGGWIPICFRFPLVNDMLWLVLVPTLVVKSDIHSCPSPGGVVESTFFTGFNTSFVA